MASLGSEEHFLSALKVAGKMPVEVRRRPPIAAAEWEIQGAISHHLDIESVKGFDVPAHRLNDLAFKERRISLRSGDGAFWVVAV